MATYTPNIDLKKPAQSDKIRIADLNGNADNIDAALGADFGVSNKPSVNDAVNSLGAGLAIISNGDIHAAITAGQYVYVRGHGTLTEGLYVATANVSQNGALTGNNVDAVSGGGLNALNSNITNQAKIYRINITSEEVAENSYFKFVSDYLADGFVAISNNNEIHFNASANVMVFVNLIGKTSEQGTRAWIQLEGGNTTEQSIGYGVYQKHTLIGNYSVNTSTVLKLKNLDAYSFTPGGGGTIGSRIIIKRN